MGYSEYDMLLNTDFMHIAHFKLAIVQVYMDSYGTVVVRWSARGHHTNLGN